MLMLSYLTCSVMLHYNTAYDLDLGDVSAEKDSLIRVCVWIALPSTLSINNSGMVNDIKLIIKAIDWYLIIRVICTTS